MKTKLPRELETAVALDVLFGEDDITGQNDNEQVCCTPHQILVTLLLNYLKSCTVVLLL